MPEAAIHLGSGKVRELYALGDDRLLLVASDRISTFDVVLPTEIPDKGRVLTGLAAFWFARTRSICPNHLLALRADGRSTECRRLTMLPIECVVRGYLAGSGWKDYRTSGEVCGHRLPAGLVESDRLPEPIFTPATKAQSGHDENIDAETAAGLVGGERWAEVESVALALYSFASRHAEARGIILADTKFELGLDQAKTLVLGDEALTPDSSRFWPADEYSPGGPQPSYDKQYVRDYCESLGWDKTDPGPEVPADVVAGTRARYVEAFEEYDLEALTALIREDAQQSMPPYDMWLSGRDDIFTWWFGPGIGCKGSRVLPAGTANGSPAYGQYKPSPNGGYDPWALQVIEVKDGRIGELTFFLDTERLFPLWGLPPHLDA